MKMKLKPFPNLINHTAKPMGATSAEVTVSVVSTSRDIHSSKSYQLIQNSYDRYDKLRESVLEQCDYNYSVVCFSLYRYRKHFSMLFCVIHIFPFLCAYM